MPLTFNIRHADRKDLQLKGDLPTEDLDLDLHDDILKPAPSLQYDLVVQNMDDALLVQGRVELSMEQTCVRCLKNFQKTIEIEPWACHLPLSGEDAATVTNDLVNLTPYLREDILLALPQHPLCEAGCEGLKVPASIKGPDALPEPAESPWSELDKLKL